MTYPPVEKPDQILLELAARYEQHLRGYERWRAAAEDAASKLDEDDLDAFLQVHEKKQQLAESLRKEEPTLRRLRETAAARLGMDDFTLGRLEAFASDAADDDVRKAVDRWRDLLQKLAGTMEHVAKVERRIETKLRHRLQSLARSATQARTSRRAVQAYSKEGDDNDARFVDRKG